MQYLYKPITNKRQIGRKRPYSAIKWIVIHYTGNYSAGAGAMSHYRYLERATRYGSAHYYVDDKQIVQTIGDSYTAWSVGDNQGHGRYLNGCTNANSISIEMCVNSDSDQGQTYKNVLELTKNLMAKFSVPASRVCRHYDVSRKDCPHNLRAGNWAKWWQFKEDIKRPIDYKIDLTKDSAFGPEAGKKITDDAVVEDVEGLKEQDEKRKEYIMTRKLDPDHLPEWAEKEWEEAKTLGITDGTRPGDIATRAEVAAMLVRALKESGCKCKNIETGL